MPERFLEWFKRYLVAAALLAHVAALGVIVAAIVVGPGPLAAHGLAVGKAAARYVRSAVREAERSLEARTVALLGAPLQDVHRFRPLPLPPPDRGYARILRVGPQREYRTPSAAARVARDGDLVEIEAGTYAGDSAVWAADDLAIRAVGGVVRLDAAGTQLVQHKAIWVIGGDNNWIENVEFANARSRDRNGAGLRLEGRGLHVVSCYFHDNESGIMTSNDRSLSLVVEQSEFARNGHASGQAHQIYVGAIDFFELRASYVHDTHIGSAVKSRARRNVIRYNRIVDGPAGRSNYTIDLSAGGYAEVVGNVLQQGAATGNYTILTYAPEQMPWEDNLLVASHNTFVSDRPGSNFVYNHSPVAVRLTNNLFRGDGSVLEGNGELRGNVVEREPGLLDGLRRSLGGSDGNRYAADVGLVDPAAGAFRLRGDSPAIDAGVAPDPAVGGADVASHEYVHPLSLRERAVQGPLDAGAHEYEPDAGAESPAGQTSTSSGSG